MPEPGDRLEAFELEQSIGVGGMGAVFRALDTSLDRHVALKILPPEQSNDSDVVQRFYQEARAAARLDHENIARVFTIGHDRGYHFIAFEYIEGTTIRDRVAEHGPLPIDEAINYTLQIAGAMVHATERGVVHRDIKPSNIIVTPQGRAKLVDMGLARRFERGVDSDAGLTQSGMTLGTFDYISPEQARDPRDVDVRSDLYSLGCTLFHMLTGRPPFPEGTVLQKLLQHQEEPAPNVRSINPTVPPDLATIILKLMAKDRDRRYQTPEQLVRDLLTVAGALGLRSISPEGLVWMASSRAAPWERHLIWGLPTLGLAIVVAALLFWWGPPAELQPTVTTDIAPLIPSATSNVPSGSRVPPTTKTANTTESGRPSPATTQPFIPKTNTAVANGPREIRVRSDDDPGLSALLASAPWGSTLILEDSGPFDLIPVPIDREPTAGMAGRMLTIRAAAGVRPVLRLARNAPDSDEPRALLQFHGGQIMIEGVEFFLDPGDRDGPLAAIQAEDTDLTLHGCQFLCPESRSGSSSLAALRLHFSGENRRRDGGPVPVIAQNCHFDGGQLGLWVRGPSVVQLSHCTFGPSNPTFWFDNAEAPGSAAVKTKFLLNHVTVLAGKGPVFRLTRTDALVRMNDSVVAPPRQDETTLIAIDNPDRLHWVGQSNHYAWIDTYLQPTRGDRDPIRRFDAWAGDLVTTREIDSTHSDTSPWEQDDPLRALSQARENPTVAFQLAATELPSPETGARRGPLGPIAQAAARLLANAVGSSEPEPRREPVTQPKVPEPSPASTVTPEPEEPEPFEPTPPLDLNPMPGPMPGPMVVEPAPLEEDDPEVAGRTARYRRYREQQGQYADAHDRGNHPRA